MADLVTLRGKSGRDCPQWFSIAAHCDHLADGILLGLVRHKLAIIAATEPQWQLATKIPAASFLVGFDLPDPFANAITFRLGESGGDCQKQPREPITSNVTAEVEQMQVHTARLKIFDDLESVQRRAKQTIELHDDYRVAALQLSEQRASGRTFGNGNGTADGFLNHNFGQLKACMSA